MHIEINQNDQLLPGANLQSVAEAVSPQDEESPLIRRRQSKLARNAVLRVNLRKDLGGKLQPISLKKWTSIPPARPLKRTLLPLSIHNNRDEICQSPKRIGSRKQSRQLSKAPTKVSRDKQLLGETLEYDSSGYSSAATASTAVTCSLRDSISSSRRPSSRGNKFAPVSSRFNSNSRPSSSSSHLTDDEIIAYSEEISADQLHRPSSRKSITGEPIRVLRMVSRKGSRASKIAEQLSDFSDSPYSDSISSVSEPSIIARSTTTRFPQIKGALPNIRKMIVRDRSAEALKECQEHIKNTEADILDICSKIASIAPQTDKIMSKLPLQKQIYCKERIKNRLRKQGIILTGEVKSIQC